MENKYLIDNNGVITYNGIIIPMNESNPLYIEYIKFLEKGGTVEDIVTINSNTIREVFNFKSKNNRLITKESAIKIHDQAIEDIISYLQVLQDGIDRLENEKQIIGGISGHFTSNDGKTITIKNGIIKSITIKNK